MTIISLQKAQENLNDLINETTSTHRPIIIKGKRVNAILLSETDWNAVNETLHLLSIPGMRESIIAGLATDIGKCSQITHWSE